MEKLTETIFNFLFSTFEYLTSAGGANVELLKISPNTIHVAVWIWSYIGIIGSGVSLIYFLFELNQKVAFEGHDMTLKSFFAPFLKLFMAFVLLQYGGRMVDSILNFYNGMLDDVKSITISADGAVIDESETPPSGSDGDDTDPEAEKNEAKEKIRTSVSEAGIIEVLALLPLALIMWLIQIVLSFVWDYKALVFKIEFLWKMGITPIAMADVYNGSHSNAMRWIRGLLATAIYGASFILVAKLGNGLVTGNMSDMITAMSSGTAGLVSGFKSILMFIVVPFAELGVLGAIKQATKEALG